MGFSNWPTEKSNLDKTEFCCCRLPPFVPGENLVRIVRTLEPSPEPIFVPPDIVLRANAAIGGSGRFRRALAARRALQTDQKRMLDEHKAAQTRLFQRR